MRKILNLLRGRRTRLENDLDRELRYHFDRRVEDLRAEGRPEDDARKQAAIEMGGIEQVQEDVRETWTLRWLDAAARDARYAARSLARSPGFTATAVASLAIGIGASAAIFSLLDQVLLRAASYVTREETWTRSSSASCPCGSRSGSSSSTGRATRSRTRGAAVPVST